MWPVIHHQHYSLQILYPLVEIPYRGTPGAITPAALRFGGPTILDLLSDIFTLPLKYGRYPPVGDLGNHATQEERISAWPGIILINRPHPSLSRTIEIDPHESY